MEEFLMERYNEGGNKRVFLDSKGKKQECPPSPLLFNLLTANMKEKNERVKWGGVRLRGERVYTLA